jgi:hypothetical protein
MGVYLDDCDSGDTIEGNVFFRAGRAVMIGGGRDNLVRNNLIVDCPIGIHMDGRGMAWKQWNSPAFAGWNLEEKATTLHYTEPPWSLRYPRLAAILREEPRLPLNNAIQRNVFVDCTKQVCDFDGNVRSLLSRLPIANNLAVNTAGAKNLAAAPQVKGFASLAGSETDPIRLGFRNAREGDFALLANARLLKEVPGFERIPLEKIGLYKDEYRRED